ncbi:hypothetical protein EYF80_008036 [Liparis tanakae]|uniref:Uncharacterized protein n=1 Tax=Liparis tanakae TaxID=230148 RepID=A0A4Z2IUC0_9TELE|nr:hypothetical protein EYF80_008036 [Liparis tanakae]
MDTAAELHQGCQGQSIQLNKNREQVEAPISLMKTDSYVALLCLMEITDRGWEITYLFISDYITSWTKHLKKLEACVSCMFHFVSAWHTNSHIIL